ncbi:MAG: ABC transporter ATP-binding protein [Ignavibacteriales bacterium]|nr:ABC transporter ATP-binding protein [Ignavibacteriales bacterium]
MKVFSRYLRYFLQYKLRIGAGLFSVAVWSLSDTVSAFLIGQLVEILQKIGEMVGSGAGIILEMPVKVLGYTITQLSIHGSGETMQLILTFAGALLAIILIKVCFVYIREYVMSSAQQKILMTFRIELFDTVLLLPVRYFDQQKTGRVMSRLTNDVNNMEQSLYLTVEIVQNLLYSLIYAGALFFSNWQLAVFTIVIFSFSGIISRKFGDRVRSFSLDLTNTLADISAFLQEKISSIRIVKSFTREDYERATFRKKVEENYRHSMKIVRTMALLSPTNEFFNTFVASMLVVFTGYLFLQGTVDMKSVITFLILVNFLAKPVKALGENVARIQKTLVSAGLIFDMLDLEKEQLQAKPGKTVVERGEVRFEDVSFSYNTETPALSHVTFSVKPGEKVALVGPSGGGKTTLINLIPRFYQLTSGSIRIDGVDIREMNLSDLRSQIGIVPQEVVLFAGTIEENIRYGKLDATKKEILNAATMANAHSFIVNLEHGYETEIGERGVQLSGGQRQRLAIARAILRDPKILLLDEATSALDSESELMVQEALDRLMQGRTSIIIAHRLSTIYHCDTIIVLERGSIAESGTHDELLRNDSGLYKRLYSLQFSDEKEKRGEQ